MQGRSVVVTGIGAATGRASDAAGLWTSLFSAAVVTSAIELDPTGLRTPARWGDLAGRAAVDAGAEAWRHAGFGEAGRAWAAPAADRVGVVLGVGLGGLRAGERVSAAARAGHGLAPRDVLSMSAADPVAAVARWVGASGPCRGVASGCASSSDAVAEGARMIAWGVCDVVVVGGCDAGATPGNLAGLRRIGVLSHGGRARPFDGRRDGLVLAEGAAAMVLEAEDTCARRGGTPLARVVGSAAGRDDGAHPAALSADGGMVHSCVTSAAADAGLAVPDLVALIAHATGTVAGDEAEASGLRSALAGAGVPVTALKAATGHAMAASGALDAVGAVLALASGVVPPVLGFDRVADGSAAGDLDLVREARQLDRGPIATVASGFGGFTTVLVLAPP